MSKTIYALSTLYGKSAIAIIRVSGKDALYSLKKLTNKTNFIPNKQTFVNLYDSNSNKIDEALVCYYKSPNSYTGEDVVEYNIHGSLIVIREMLQELSTFKEHYLAERGEFTRQAYLNNKLDLINAEGVNDLINAETNEQKKLALKELNGDLGGSYNKLYSKILSILALVESTIDFSDQDIPDNLMNDIINNTTDIINNISQEINKASSVYKLKTGINVIILGDANVGKSTLINYLCKEDVSIVANIPGTTRDIIENFVDIEGFPVKFIDSAGIRKTSDVVENIGIKKAIKKAKQADIKIIILDASNKHTPHEVLNLIDSNTIVLVNKIDLIDDSFNIKHLDEHKVFKASLLNKTGIDEFKNTLIEKLKEVSALNVNPIVLQERHKQILTRVVENLTKSIEQKDNIEFMAFHLRESLNSMSLMFGNVESDDILDIIFSSFCIGK